MDIEGSELKAIQGMKTTIEKSKNLIIFTEFDEESLIDAESDPQNFLSLIIESFLVYYVDDEKSQLYELDPTMFFNDKKFKQKTNNLLCVKNSTKIF